MVFHVTKRGCDSPRVVLEPPDKSEERDEVLEDVVVGVEEAEDVLVDVLEDEDDDRGARLRSLDMAAGRATGSSSASTSVMSASFDSSPSTSALPASSCVEEPMVYSDHNCCTS